MRNFPLTIAVVVLTARLAAGCIDQAPIKGASCEGDVHACPPDYFCNGEGTCEPEEDKESWQKPCTTNSDCTAGVCLLQAQVCVGCIDHNDCVSHLCERLTHICKGCKADYQCPSGACDEETGICEEKSSTDSRP